MEVAIYLYMDVNIFLLDVCHMMVDVLFGIGDVVGAINISW